MPKLRLATIFILAAFACLVDVPAQAADVLTEATEHSAVKKQPNAQYNYGRGYSVVTGWHKIDGWQQSIIKRDPNLIHWQWLPMQEADKNYIRLPAGGDPKTRSQQSSHYCKPIHAPLAQVPGSRYIKPKHLPLPGRPVQVASTSIGWRSIKDRERVQAHLSFPKSKESATRTATHIKWRAPAGNSSLAQATDCMSTQASLSQSSEADDFQSGQPSPSPYGPVRRMSSRSIQNANTAVRGQLLKKRPS